MRHVRVGGKLSQLRRVIREDGEYTSQRKTPEPRSEPADTRETVKQPKPAEPAWMGAYEALRHDWNTLIEDTRKAGIPLFYAKGYMDIVARVQTIAENPDIPAKLQAPLIQVLENHQRYLSTRKQILEYPGKAQRQMDARASLHDVAGAAAQAPWSCRVRDSLRPMNDAIAISPNRRTASEPYYRKSTRQQINARSLEQPQRHSPGPHCRRRCCFTRYRSAAGTVARVSVAPRRDMHMLRPRIGIGSHDRTADVRGA